jgi:hypothetical protein
VLAPPQIQENDSASPPVEDPASLPQQHEGSPQASPRAAVGNGQGGHPQQHTAHTPLHRPDGYLSNDGRGSVQVCVCFVGLPRPFQYCMYLLNTPLTFILVHAKIYMSCITLKLWKRQVGPSSV